MQLELWGVVSTLIISRDVFTYTIKSKGYKARFQIYANICTVSKTRTTNVTLLMVISRQLYS